MSQLLALMVLGLASGLLIGCIGIGGVILVPALVFIGTIPMSAQFLRRCLLTSCRLLLRR